MPKRKSTPPDPPAEASVPPHIARIGQIEANLLQALFQLAAGPERNEIIAALDEFQWLIPNHYLMYQVVAHLPMIYGVMLMAHMPGVLARSGFPDVDVLPYFTPLQLRAHELVARCHKMMAALDVSSPAPTRRRKTAKPASHHNPRTPGDAPPKSRRKS